MGKEVNLGGFMSETLALIRDNGREFAIFVILLSGLNTVGLMLGFVEPNDQIGGFNYGVSVNGSAGVPAFFYQLLVAVVSIVATYFLLTRYLASRNLLSDGNTRIWAYFGMMILTILGMMAGLLLLIVPGLILIVRWSASSGYLIGERKGVVESLGASWDATRGHSWPIFFAGLILIVGLGVLSGLTVGLLGVANVDWLAVSISAMVEATGNGVFLAFGIAVYSLVGDPIESTTDVFE